MIRRVGNFFHEPEPRGQLSVGIESDRIQECVREARRVGAYGVFGHPSFGFKGKDLSFLADIDFVKSVWFWDVTLTDVDGIYNLSDLRSFGIHPKRPPVDFSRLRSLERLVWDFNLKDAGLEQLSRLTLLNIHKLNPKGGDLLHQPERFTVNLSQGGQRYPCFKLCHILHGLTEIAQVRAEA